jgi:hypothetical protein|tara:strand:- start:1645 stop:1878 length:234 start_codon:yes stop_codon:yes gene_type:complete
MMYLARPKNFKEWVSKAYDKIERTIDSCQTVEHIDAAKKMVDNFIIVTALEEESNSEELEAIAHLFWTRINLKLITL